MRQHLEFGIQAWNTHLVGDKNWLELVQRRATRIPHVLKVQSYKSLCCLLGITSLKERRIRGDLIKFFKFHRGIELIDCQPINQSLEYVVSGFIVSLLRIVRLWYTLQLVLQSSFRLLKQNSRACCHFFIIDLRTMKLGSHVNFNIHHLAR